VTAPLCTNWTRLDRSVPSQVASGFGLPGIGLPPNGGDGVQAKLAATMMPAQRMRALRIMKVLPDGPCPVEEAGIRGCHLCSLILRSSTLFRNF